MSNYFVLQVNKEGIPGRLTPASDLEDAKEIASTIARRNKVSEKRIKELIMDDDFGPGCYYLDDTETEDDIDHSGVWVLLADDKTTIEFWGT
jgi:hypothetical protein